MTLELEKISKQLKLFSELYGESDSFIRFPIEEVPKNGLLGYTEELNLKLLYSGYVQGIFPWFNEDEAEPVLWWSPEPRFVLIPEELHTPKSLAKFIKKSPFKYTMDTSFEKVIRNCAEIKRPNQNGTWIGSKIIETYSKAHLDGNAHSVEVWHGSELVGGFYGILVGQVFFGESMFSKEPDTAKSAFVHFVNAFKECGGKLIDSQVYTDNIARFGGKNISRQAFLRLESNFLYGKLNQNLKDTFYKVVENSKKKL